MITFSEENTFIVVTWTVEFSLNFSEFVDANTLNITSFQLLNSRTPTTRYLLTLVTMTPLSNTTLEDFDINSIKQDANLAVSEATTFLSITSSAITDASGNPITDVIVSSALYWILS